MGSGFGLHIKQFTLGTLMRTNRQRDLSIQFFKKVNVKNINDANKKKAPDILAANITPESPKNIFGNKQTIALILKNIGP